MEIKLRPLPRELLSRLRTPVPGLRGRGRFGLGHVLGTIGTAGLFLITSCTPTPVLSEKLHQYQTATEVARGIGGQDGTPYVNPIREATTEAAATATAAAGSPPTPEPSATSTPENK